MDEKTLQLRLIKFYRELDLILKKCDRSPDQISVLFATKYLTSSQLIEFVKIYKDLRNDVVIIGENRVQDAEEKFKDLEAESPALKKIFIGNLQKNKIHKAISLFDEIWGVDSMELAKDLNNRIESRILPIFLEINISGEKTKHGINSREAEKAINEVIKFPNLKLNGLMTMAQETKNRGLIKQTFTELRTLADKYNLKTSMGQSSDWNEAVEAGSDIIRIGSRIFVTENK